MSDPHRPVPGYPATPPYGHRPGGGSAVPAGPSTSPATPPSRTSGAWLSVGLALVFNLVTLVGVLGFGWPPGNVFLLFWAENAVLGLCTLLKVASAQAPAASPVLVNGRDAGRSPALYAVFFTLHYGIFCLVHLGFTAVVAFRVGVEPTFLWLGLPLVLIAIRYSVETVTTWFGQDGLRRTTSPQQAMMQPYPRVIVLHVSILVAFGLVIAGFAGDDRLTQVRERLEPLLRSLPGAWQTQGVAVVAVLVLVKTVVDVVTTQRVLRPR